MDKSESRPPRSKPRSSRNNMRRAVEKPALIKQSKLKKSRDQNPFGIQLLKLPEADVLTLLTPEAVEYQYGEIRRIFFPDFDKKQRWNLRRGFSHYFIASVFLGTKTIVYTSHLLGQPIIVLNVILIHELCHAELGAKCRSHGKRWRDRMDEAAGTAVRIRDVNLEFALWDEADRYDPSSSLYVPPVNARKCYDRIARLANGAPDWSFEDVMYRVGRALYEPGEVLIKRYKKCREVFEKAKKRSIPVLPRGWKDVK